MAMLRRMTAAVSLIRQRPASEYIAQLTVNAARPTTRFGNKGYASASAAMPESSPKSTDSPKLPRSTLMMISKLRSQVQCTIGQASTALEAAKADLATFEASVIPTDDAVLAKALATLRKEFLTSALAKSKKLASRPTPTSLIAVHVAADASSAVAVELASETDFVGNSDPFCRLASQAAASVVNSVSNGQDAGGDGSRGRTVLVDAASAPFTLIDSGDVLHTPLVADPANVWAFTSPTVHNAIVETIGKVQENICLRRVLAGVQQPHPSPSTGPDADAAGKTPDAVRLFGAYAHSGGANLPPGLGRVASIVSLCVRPATTGSAQLDPEARRKVALLARRIAQHVAGFAPYIVRAGVSPNTLSDAARSSPSSSNSSNDDSANLNSDESALMTQPFLFGGGSVGDVVASTASSLGVDITVEDIIWFNAST